MKAFSKPNSVISDIYGHFLSLYDTYLLVVWFMIPILRYEKSMQLSPCGSQNGSIYWPQLKTVDMDMTSKENHFNRYECIDLKSILENTYCEFLVCWLSRSNF